jgi:tRNA-specific 2-thiouridylase
VKIRYKAHEVPAEAHVNPGNAMQIHFAQPVPDATPGQAAVLYNGEVCLGGGIISSISRRK